MMEDEVSVEEHEIKQPRKVLGDGSMHCAPVMVSFPWEDSCLHQLWDSHVSVRDKA